MRLHGSYWSRVGPHVVHARVAAPREVSALRDVVLVHGLGVSSSYMVPLLEEVGRHARCWAPDLPGHGASDEPGRTLPLHDLVAVLEQWLLASRIERPVLVGNSYGCQLVVELARRGIPTSGLVLVGPVTDTRRDTPRQQVPRLALDLLHEPVRLVALQALDYFRTGPLRTWREFSDSRGYDIAGALAQVDDPVRIVRGERDAIAPTDWASRLALQRAGTEVVEVRGSGHCAHYTAPRHVESVVLPLALGTDTDAYRAAAGVPRSPYGRPGATSRT